MKMTKPWRDELRTLARAEKKLRRDYSAQSTALDREAATIQNRLNKAYQGVIKELHKIQRRRAILEGRLS